MLENNNNKKSVILCLETSIIVNVFVTK